MMKININYKKLFSLETSYKYRLLNLTFKFDKYHMTIPKDF